jgi:hypothetical protein
LRWRRSSARRIALEAPSAGVIEGLRDIRKLVEHLPKADDDRQPCPVCAEAIRPEAALCPFCRSDLHRATAAVDRLLDSDRPAGRSR